MVYNTTTAPLRRQWLPHSPSRWGRRSSHREDIDFDRRQKSYSTCWGRLARRMRFLLSLRYKFTSTQIKVWNMRRVQTELCSALFNSILLLHAISACSTTSRPFGITKSAPLKKFSATTESEQGSLMQLIDTCADDVVKAGENALVAMYGGRRGEPLSNLRHRKYDEKVCTKDRQVEA